MPPLPPIPRLGRRTLLLYGLGIAIVLISLGNIMWSTIHLNRIGSNSWSAANSKAQFISEGSFSNSLRHSASEAVNIVKFVAYGGMFPENHDESANAIIDDRIDSKSKDARQEESLNHTGESGSIIPFELSINHLKLITHAPGKPPTPPLPPHASSSVPSEDFLPVVRPNEVTFRWRHRPRVGSPAADAARVKAYRIVARRFVGCDNCGSKGDGDGVLWDSDKVVLIDNEHDIDLPTSIRWPAEIALDIGHMIEWRVTLWDMADQPSTSSWTKFAVGPEKEDDWKGEWIVHAIDMTTFHSDRRGDACEKWYMRRPLPLFRGLLPSQSLQSILHDDDPLVSALLFVSGLGSFRATFDGVPLSPSGPIDPPFTDYSQRVSYRGFDVTNFLVGDDNVGSHVVGITVGSGWWDHRPVTGMAKPELLANGPLTVIAQLYLTTASGKVHITMPTKGSTATWQVSRGHIKESDLFTGEMIDLSTLTEMEGWDTSSKWSIAETKLSPSQNHWSLPVSYITNITQRERREKLSVMATALDKSEMTTRTTRSGYLASPIGQLVPSEIPPILPMERIAPDEIHDLGSGRWLLDFGRAFSGMLHFDEGLPQPIIPHNNIYPRAHGFGDASEKRWSFITVVYGESLEMTTGDINRVLVAGMGLHDGGPRHNAEPEGAQDNAFCFPDDHDGILTQKDIYVYPSESITSDMFSRARQSHFTTHAFRFAEICCTAEPPTNVHALMYRTAMQEWGTFDSSSVLINGGYELVKNSMRSNLLSVQSDCPHREKLPYGGDLIANSPAAMHMFDMSAFYKKTIRDWMDAQWDNGAYTETSVWQDLNDYAGIGKGAGETVWATAPPVLTVRHMQHYGDLDLLKESIGSHTRWLEFLNKEFDSGMIKMGYDKKLKTYRGDGSGLGDWLALPVKDTYLTHTGFYMASSRCIAYISNKLGNTKMRKKSVSLAELIRNRISSLYLWNGRDTFTYPMARYPSTPGPEMSLFARIVPGEKRCAVLKNWFRRKGETWDGDEETLFLNELDSSYAEQLVNAGVLIKDDEDYLFSVSQWQGFGEGIFSIRYALKTLSDMGFHHIALRKASGIGFGTTEYMLTHNATTMWETWWRSEDVYSRNHPMLGAIAEWMSSSVAGVSVHPTTVGGRQVLFWPRFPKSATMLKFASSIQGTPVGDFAIAWRFENLPEDKSKYDSALVTVRIRLLVPPGGSGMLRLPLPSSKTTKIRISHTNSIPDLDAARDEANRKCMNRRKHGLGFHWNWEYDRQRKKWYTHSSRKSIGTACESFLFNLTPEWSEQADITHDVVSRTDSKLSAGLYDLIVTNWKLEKEEEGTGRLGNIPQYFHPNYNPGPFCNDSHSFDWHIDDATHII
eukprot:scaffold10365_cov102-Skeletonema_dohrnii-CCMP3373.AAC.5